MKVNRRVLYIKALSGRAEVFNVVGILRNAAADFRNTLRLSDDLGKKRDALIGLCKLYRELGDYDQEMSCADSLIRITGKTDLCSRGNALIMKAAALRDMGKYRSSLEYATRSIRLYRLAQKDTKRKRSDRQRIQGCISDAYNTMGMVYNLQGKYGSALMFFKKSLAIFKKINNQIAMSHSLNNIGLTCWHNGQFEGARVHFNKSLAISQKIGYKNAISMVLGNMGLIYCDAKPRIALEYFQKAIYMSKEIGNRANTANNLNNMGLCCANMCDYHNALEYYDQCLKIFLKIGNKHGAAMTYYNIGMVHFDRADYEKALAYEKLAEKTALGINVMEALIRCSILKAQVFRAQKKYSKSTNLLQKTFKLAEKYKMADLMMVAAKQYVKTAIEGGTGKYMRGISKYVTLLLKYYKNADSDDTKCGLLSVLIKYDIAEKKYVDAGKKLSVLSGLAAKLGDKYLTAETLFARVQLYSAMGKEHSRHVLKLKELVNKLGCYFLLDELKKMDLGSNLHT